MRHRFYDLQQAHASLITAQVLERIGTPYAIEAEIRGRPRRSVAKFGNPIPPLTRLLHNLFQLADEAFPQVRHDGGYPLYACSGRHLECYSDDGDL